MKKLIVTFSAIFALGAGTSVFACENFSQVASEPETDAFGNTIVTYTNICDGVQSAGGRVITNSEGVTEQLDEQNRLIGGWGGNQDPYTVTILDRPADENGQATGYAGIFSRTDSEGNSYRGGAIVYSPDGQIVNQYGWDRDQSQLFCMSGACLDENN